MSVFGTIKRFSIKFSALLLLVSFVSLPGCGGGGGGGNTTSSTLGTATNISELGLIEGADINISTIDGDSLYEATTNQDGEYILDKDEFKSEVDKLGYEVKFLLITSTGGEDTDPDDDGEIIDSEKKDVNGLVKGIISYSDLIDNDGVRTNLLTTSIADIIIDGEIEISEDNLNRVVSELGVEDTNSDGVIDNEDSFVYDIVNNDSEIEEKLRGNGYLDSIHNGDEIARTEIVQAMDSSMEPVTFQQTDSSSSSSITLKPLNSKNLILYHVDRDANETLTENYSHSIYNDEIIAVEQGQTLYVQECKDIENCYEEQVLYNGGETLQANISVDSDAEAYSEPVEVANLRTELEAEIVKNDKLDSVETLESEFTQLQNEQANKVADYEYTIETIYDALNSEPDRLVVSTDTGSLSEYIANEKHIAILKESFEKQTSYIDSLAIFAEKSCIKGDLFACARHKSYAVINDGLALGYGVLIVKKKTELYLNKLSKKLSEIEFKYGTNFKNKVDQGFDVLAETLAEECVEGNRISCVELAIISLPKAASDIVITDSILATEKCANTPGVSFECFETGLVVAGTLGKVGQLKGLLKNIDNISDVSIFSRVDSLLGKHGITSAFSNKQEFVEKLVGAGFDPKILTIKTPATNIRFEQIIIDTFKDGKQFLGRLGNIDTRVATLTKASEFEKLNLLPQFEYPVNLLDGRKRYVDLVIGTLDDKIDEYIQFVKTNNLGKIIRGDEFQAAEDIEKALRLNNGKVQLLPSN